MVDEAQATSRMERDLASSGLLPQDVGARPLGAAERTATRVPLGVEGYVLPYFNAQGRPLPFYRVKLFDHKPKYKQLPETGNHVYFPLGFRERLLEAAQKKTCIILTEGEKKAAAATKAGWCAVALGGIDSWKNRTVVVPEGAELKQNTKGNVVIKLPAGQDGDQNLGDARYAEGFLYLVEVLSRLKLPLVIVYDAELTPQGSELPVQVAEAAFKLGVELRKYGLPLTNIRNLILEAPPRSRLHPQGKPLSPGSKLGLDDFLEHIALGSAAFADQLQATLTKRTAFPRHPNPAQFVAKQLAKTKNNRDKLQMVALAVLSDLDVRGSRLYCAETDQLFYFDHERHSLLPVNFRLTEQFGQTPFGIRLYQDYGLTINDRAAVAQLGAQFAGEEPVQNVTPERVIKVTDQAIYYQLSNSRVLKVTSKTITVVDNGTDGILFEVDKVTAVNEEVVMANIKHLQQQHKDHQKPLSNYWYSVLQEARVKDSPDDNNRRLLSLLYYISPWFYRWRGTQLPVEMMVGEAGSGKSTLFTLRLGILTGVLKLRNAPSTLRDWAASVADSGGLHVTDNVHLTATALKQQLSDELCRVVTASDPGIEARKLYSDNTLITIPVKTVFAITAIKQPFTNTDIVQRSIITELDKGTNEIVYEADWTNRQLRRFGGREGWIAQQAYFAHRMLDLIGRKWQRDFRAQYRLVNVEQLLCLAADLCGWSREWIPGFLAGAVDEKMAESDWAMEGLLAFAAEWRTAHGNSSARTFTSKDISQWAHTDEDFVKCTVLSNPRSLGRYLVSTAHQVARVTGIYSVGSRANVIHYRVGPTAKDPE